MTSTEIWMLACNVISAMSVVFLVFYSTIRYKQGFENGYRMGARNQDAMDKFFSAHEKVWEESAFEGDETDEDSRVGGRNNGGCCMADCAPGLCDGNCGPGCKAKQA